MFSGIIQSIGRVTSAHLQGESLWITVKPVKPRLFVHSFRPGQSIAINGVCLTINKKQKGEFIFEVMQETRHKTSLGTVVPGDFVNIETPLRAGEPIDGHIVQGHIDGIGHIVSLESSDGATYITFEVPVSLVRYLAPQGSITVDGVGLTIAKTQGQLCTIACTVYTMEHTTFQEMNPKVRQKVNIECDMFAKYITWYLSTKK